MSAPTNDPLHASDPLGPTPAAETTPPPPKEYSVGASAPPAWSAAPRLDYSRAYAPPRMASPSSLRSPALVRPYGPPSEAGYGAPPAYSPPGGYPPQGGYPPPPQGYPPQQGYAPPQQGYGDPRAAAYFGRMHAARAPPGEEDEEEGEEGDEDEEEGSDEEETVSRASTKDSKKRAARAALAHREKQQRLEREKYVLTQLMLAAPENVLDTLFQAPNVQAAVAEFVQGRLDIDKLERDLIVIQCVQKVRGQHASNRSLDDQAPRIASRLWNLAGMGAEISGVVPPGSWDLSTSEWSAEEENARNVQRDWVRTAMSMMGAGGGASPMAMTIQQLLTLATPLVAIGIRARSMAPPAAIQAPPPAYPPPQPAPTYPPPQPAPTYMSTPPPQAASVPAAGPPASYEAYRTARRDAMYTEPVDLPAASAPAAQPSSGEGTGRPPTPEPPPITMSYAAAPRERVSAATDDPLGGGFEL